MNTDTLYFTSRFYILTKGLYKKYGTFTHHNKMFNILIYVNTMHHTFGFLILKRVRL